MFIVIMVIILGTCAVVLSSIYYNTTALQKTYGSVNTYYGAYYGAISSIERGLLMTKLKYPGYEGSGGFIGEETIGAQSNAFAEEFWRFNHPNNTMLWTVNSKTDHIAGSIDNKTLRLFSFINYTDLHPSEYSDQYDGPNYYGIDEGLVFSGVISPRTNGGSNLVQNSIDFNRFFGMRQEQYTIRGLLLGNNTYNRANTLSGQFYFGLDPTSEELYTKNPWPTTTGAWSN